MTRKTVLTRTEIERAALWLQLNKRYDRVMFIQKHRGIGLITWARFYNPDQPDHYEEIEVTDTENW